MVNITTTVNTEIDLDLEVGARWFAHLRDHEQAEFFCLVAKEAESWDHKGDRQWWHIGNRLATSEWSTDGGRDLIRGIAKSMEDNLLQRSGVLEG